MDCAVGERCSNECLDHACCGDKIGPVGDDEDIVIAVFDDGDLKIGDRLTPEHFAPRRLGRGEISIARLKYTTLDEFQRFVIDTGIRRAPFVGVAKALASDIRKVTTNVGNGHRARQARGVCVIDRVDEGDHRSHAALQACKELPFGQTRLGEVRTEIGVTLTDVFSAIEDVATVFGVEPPITLPTVG